MKNMLTINRRDKPMTKAVLCCTNFSRDYWGRTQPEAPYDFPDYLQRLLNEIKELTFPIFALGIYKEGRNGDFRNEPFQFMKIMGIREEGQRVYFHTELIQSDNTIASDRINRVTNILVEVQEPNLILTNLSNLGVTLPAEWVELLGNVRQPTTLRSNWKNWIGEYFKRLNHNDIGDNEFEDIVADIFRAIGFEVEQMGYKRPRERVPDGVLTASNVDFAIVYDCKNQRNYYLSAADERAMREYLEDQTKIIKECKRMSNIKVAPYFIARSFNNNVAKIRYQFLTVENLLRLFYERLKKGNQFIITTATFCQLGGLPD